MANAKLTGIAEGSVVSVGGITETDWGTEAPPPDPVGTVATSLRVSPIALPDGVTSATIVSSPAEGSASIRPDGQISLDLTNLKGTPPQTVQIIIDATPGGVMPMNVPVTQGLMVNGANRGRHYMLPLDVNDRFVYEIGDNHRKMYLALDGYTKQDLATAHSTDVGSINWQNWLRDTIALEALGGDGSLYYGETYELRLAEDAGEDCWKGICKDAPSSNHLYAQRGDVFNNFSYSAQNGQGGETPLQPIVMTAFGTGDKPVLSGGSEGSYTNFLLQDVHLGLLPGKIGGVHSVTVGKWTALVGVTSEQSIDYIVTKDSGKWIQFATWYDITVNHIQKNAPKDPLLWGSFADKFQGTHVNHAEGLLVMKRFSDVSGWGQGYEYVGSNDPGFPQMPSQYNHADYHDRGVDTTIRLSTISRGALTGCQNRYGLYVDRCVYTMHNVGMQIGAGPATVDPVGGQEGSWAHVIDSMIVGSGQKQHSGNNWAGYAAGTGMVVKNDSTSLRNSMILDSGPGNTPLENAVPGVGAPLTSEGGTGAFGVKVSGVAMNIKDSGTTMFDDTIIYSWHDSADVTQGVSTGTLDGMTMESYAATVMGGTPTREEFLDWMAAQTKPYETGEQWRQDYMDTVGRLPTPRTVLAVCDFQQQSTGDTPGYRWDYRLDWSTGDLPGTVVGDSARLFGTHLTHSFSPDFPLADVDLGGGSLTQFGGVLTLTGDIKGGGTLITEGSGQVVQGAGVIEVDMLLIGGRYRTTGAISATQDITVSYNAQLLTVDTASITIGAGQTLDIRGGQGKVGFDGLANGVASYTFNGTSTLKLSSIAIVDCTLTDRKVAEFREGDVVTAAGGGTGTIVGIELFTKPIHRLYIENPTGTFSGLLNGVNWTYTDTMIVENPPADVGTVTGTVEYKMASIGEVRSGLHNDSEPVVQSTINCAGNLDVQADGMPTEVGRVILSADSIIGTFDGTVTLGTGVSNLTYNATTVTVDIA